MNVVSSRRVRYNFVHVKPHASNLQFVGLLCAIGTADTQKVVGAATLCTTLFGVYIPHF